MSAPNRRSFPQMLPKMQLHLPGIDVMTGFVITLVIIHTVLERAGGPLEAPQYYLNFGLSWDEFSGGKIWQLISHALIHANWFHLIINLLMLWFVGGRVIHILGHRGWLKIVFWGVLAGGLLHLLTGLVLTQLNHPDRHLVGVSGACLGLLVALTTLSPDSKMWPVPISGKNLGLGLILAELLLCLMQPGFNLPVFSRMGDLMVSWGGGSLFQISHACHLGGALAGWWIARSLLAPPPTLEELQKLRIDREGDIS